MCIAVSSWQIIWVRPRFISDDDAVLCREMLDQRQLHQDVTEVLLIKWSAAGLKSDFHSPKLVVYPSLRKLVFSTIDPVDRVNNNLFSRFFPNGVKVK